MEAGTAGRVAVRRDGGVLDRTRRLATETKQAFKTTEFWAMVGVVLGILISAAVINGGDTDGTDEFIARQAWLYVAIVAGAYFISRGLAKSGSREPYTDRPDRDDDWLTHTSSAFVSPSGGADALGYGCMFVIFKRSGERAQFRFYPGCLLWSLLISVVLTLLLNLLIRAFWAVAPERDTRWAMSQENVEIIRRGLPSLEPAHIG
jgi:hypothetical protein